MNNINLQQTGGFPLETDTLDFMQQAYKSLQVLSALGGNNYILTGCVVVGANVSNGMVVINGEVLEFRGGLLQAGVVIREERQSRPFQNGQTKDVFVTRYATFGTGADAIAWNTLTRITNILSVELVQKALQKSLQELSETVEGKLTQSDIKTLVEDVSVLKKIAGPFSMGGGMVLWQKSANLIPAGWAEVVNWRGRLPMGWDPNDSDFDSVGETGGVKSQTIYKTNLPAIGVGYKDAYYVENNNVNNAISGSINIGYNVSGSGDTDQDNSKLLYRNATTDNLGNNTPLSVLNPFRIVMFIEYIG